MTAVFCLPSLCLAGTSAAIASLILCHLSGKLDQASRPEHSLAALAAASFFAGCSVVLLILTTLTTLRNL